ncbi:hypothetical protein C1X26_08140 [Pseudomonas sp. MPR-R3A]|nr:hypothetical protein C1X26_08140 [Pseudomonas sp. MPR-R3A]
MDEKTIPISPCLTNSQGPEPPQTPHDVGGGCDRSHALRGNASCGALRHALGRTASRAAFPRRAW